MRTRIRFSQKKNILILSHKLVIILTINLSRKYFLENLSNTLHTMTHAMIGLFFMYLCMIYEGTRLREKKRKQKERKRKRKKEKKITGNYYY